MADVDTSDLAGVEGWLGQIILDGRWADYARGWEAETRHWQAERPDHRRIVHWISGKVIVGHPNVCQGCGIGCTSESCPSCTRQHVREADDRWQTETDDDITLGRTAWLNHFRDA